jgi:DNA-binding beta-propeller fold protein YncE
VADSENDRVQVFSAEGEFLAQWGSEGDDDGQFKQPNGIAVDEAGNVYVADSGIGNDRVQVFSAEGEFLGKWGSNGDGDGQFKQPNGIAVDGSGKVYVTDSRNRRVQVFGVQVQRR